MQDHLIKSFGPQGEVSRLSEGAFIRLRDGRILFVFSRFRHSFHDNAASDLVACYSADEGETFTGEAFDFTKPIFEELTLYAKWTPIEESSDPDSTDSSTPNLESSSTDSNESSSPESSFTPDDSSTLESSSASGESSDSAESSLPASDSNIEHSGSNSGVSEESGNENSADTPATGDAGNMAMWTALILVFTALLTYMTSTARKAR